MTKPLTIAVDGPGSAGKGTVARGVARTLRYQYIDTGAMYRAVALMALRNGVSWDDVDGLAELASRLEFRFAFEGDVLRVLVDGNDVTSANWDDYRDQRNKASSFDSRAGLALGAIVLNRLVSAVDAFRIARGREVAGEAPSLRFTSELEGDLRSPMATFRLTKELP